MSDDQIYPCGTIHSDRKFKPFKKLSKKSRVQATTEWKLSN